MIRMWWKRAEASENPRHALGRRGERVAARYLRLRGYRILARNAVFARCEIDIIARKGDTIAFVEVRTVTQGEPLLPQDTVTPAKQAHIRRAASVWIAREGRDGWYYRFDVIGIIMGEGRKPQVAHFPDAFPG
ncbi:MAG: YraN family protein [Candidatus Hydrogenedentota bacterium]